jgi:hypothetical protein
MHELAAVATIIVVAGTLTVVIAPIAMMRARNGRCRHAEGGEVDALPHRAMTSGNQ